MDRTDYDVQPVHQHTLQNIRFVARRNVTAIYTGKGIDDVSDVQLAEYSITVSLT